MTLYKKVGLNTIYQLGAKAATSIATIVGTALITRHLGAEVFGEYSVVITYVMIFFMLSDFGVNATVVKVFSQNPEEAKTNFTSIVGLRVTLAVAVAVVAALILPLMPYSYEIKIATMVGLSLLLFQSLSKATGIIFQAFLRYNLQLIASVIGGISAVYILWVGISKMDLNLTGLVALVAMGAFVPAIISIYLVKEYLTKNRWFNLNYWIYVIKDAYPLGLALSMNLLMVQSDRFLLSIMSSPLSVGFYNLSYRIFELLLVIPTFLMNSAYPILSKMKIDNPDRYKNIAKRTVSLLSMGAMLITLLTLSISSPAISFIWGVGMIESAKALDVLSLGLIAFFVTAPLSWFLVIENKQKVLPFIYGFGFLLNLGLNLIVIPRYDFVGAAAVTVITEFVVLALLIYQLRNLWGKEA